MSIRVQRPSIIETSILRFADQVHDKHLLTTRRSERKDMPRARSVSSSSESASSSEWSWSSSGEGSDGELSDSQSTAPSSPGSSKEDLKLRSSSTSASQHASTSSEPYIQMPLGVAGPLLIDNILTPIPMATLQRGLVHNTSRGCRALNANGGVQTTLTDDGISRGHCLEFESITQAVVATKWLEQGREEVRGGGGYLALKTAFESASKFATLVSLECAPTGKKVYIWLSARTGDELGAKILAKGTERALITLQRRFPTVRISSLREGESIGGSGKVVVAEAVIPGSVVKTVLRTTVEAMCYADTMRSMMGGYNTCASSILSAIFIATGQNPARMGDCGDCLTVLEPINDGKDLFVTVTLPSIEVTTVGLSSQRAVLELLGIHPRHNSYTGENANHLACIVASTVLAGELGFLSAVASGSPY